MAYLMVAAILIFLAAYMLPRLNEKKEEYTYAEIMKHFDDLDVKAYTLDLGTGELEMTLKDGETILYSVPNVSIFKEETEGYRALYKGEPRMLRWTRIITRSPIIRGSSPISRPLSSS